MNKKRVALALAAALGVNTLMVTVGEVGGQTRIAHAKQSRLLTGSEDEKRLNGIEIKTLETTVETSSSSEVTLTFSGLTKDNVSNVTGTLSYERFTERSNTDTNGSVLVVWDSSTGKAKVSGMDAPGIYSGDVTVTYKDGSKEVYNLTLRKTYEKDVLTATVDVGVGTIEVTNIKLGTTTITPGVNDVLKLYKKGSTTPVDTINTPNDSKFTVTDIKEGDVYELSYEKNGVEQGRTQIVLTRQDEAIVKVYPSNKTSSENDIKSAIASDYGIYSSSISTTSTSTSTNGVSTEVTTLTVSGSDIVTYEQSKSSANKLAGPDISSVSSSDGKIISGTLAPTVYVQNNVGGSDNFIPIVGARVSTNGTSTDANIAVGKTYMSVGGGASSVILDASSKITSASLKETGGSKFVFIDVSNGGSYLPLNASAVNLDSTSFSYVLNDDSFVNGYSSVGLVFDTVRFEDALIGSSTVSQWISLGVTENSLKPNIGSYTTESVVASLVFSKDVVDGAVVNASFEKTSASEGRLILTGGTELLKGTDENTLARKLSVTGSSSVSYIEKDFNDNLVFRVQFNGNVPSSIRWSLDKLGGTVEVNSIDAVNFDGQVVPSNANTDKLESYFEISAKFNSVVPSSDGSLGIDGSDSTRVTFDELTNGKHTISTKVTSGSYQGTYSAGIWVDKQPFTIEVKDAKSASNTSATLTIDADFFSTDDIAKVTGGVVQYSEKTTSGSTTTWSDWKDTSTAIATSDVKEDAITKTVTGLTAGKTYKFKVVYNYNDGSGKSVPVTSNVTGEVTLPTSSSSSTITGSGSSSTTTGTSTGSTSISVTTSNSTSTGTSVSVNLPSGFKYDSSKTPVAVAFKYKDSDGKIVTETKEQYSNVSVRFNGNQVEVSGLVPGKAYDEITIDYTDSKGSTRSIVLRNVQTSTTVEVEKYLANVYIVVFNRPADEAGYHFHLGNLQNKKVSLREFLLNMLTEKEFIERYKSTEEKIEALYNAIVGRSSDEAGKKFWVEEYKKVLAVYGSESTALKAIADRMVNENELKELADKMGVQW